MKEFLQSFHLDFERCVRAYGDDNLLINVSSAINGSHKDSSLTMKLTPDDSFGVVSGNVLPFNTVPFPPMEIYSKGESIEVPPRVAIKS